MKTVDTRVRMFYEPLPHNGLISSPQRWRRVWELQVCINTLSHEAYEWLRDTRVKYEERRRDWIDKRLYCNFAFFNENDVMLFKTTWS